MNFDKIIQTIQMAHSICISAHTNPDGDAIGAMVGLGLFCKQLGRPYKILLESPSALIELFEEEIEIKYINDESKEENFDCFIALDSGSTDRLVGYEHYFTSAKHTIVIDHHITNEGYGQENVVVPLASSTSELVYECIEQARCPLNKEVAKALYIGLVTDTGGFMHTCTAPRTHEIAAKLIATGIDFSTIYYKVLRATSYQAVKLQGLVSTRLKQLAMSGVYMAYITKEDIESIGASKEDIATIVSFLKNIEGVHCVAFVYPIDHSENYKLSMRADEPYDVATFCQRFGGGGHKLAAGATLCGPLEQNIIEVEKLLKMW